MFYISPKHWMNPAIKMQELEKEGCVFQERHGWERPGWFDPAKQPSPVYNLTFAKRILRLSDKNSNRASFAVLVSAIWIKSFHTLQPTDYFQVLPYDFYGSYGKSRNPNYLYEKRLAQDYTFDFPQHFNLVDNRSYQEINKLFISLLYCTFFYLKFMLEKLFYSHICPRDCSWETNASIAGPKCHCSIWVISGNTTWLVPMQPPLPIGFSPTTSDVLLVSSAISQIVA